MNTTTPSSTRPFEGSSSGLKDYIGVILRRRWVILVAALSVIGSTVYYVRQLEDVYESFSTLVLEERNTVINQAMQLRSRDLSYYEGILRSRTFIDMVLDSIGLDVVMSALPKAFRSDAQQYVRDNLSLQKTAYTGFLRLNARAPTRELAYFMASIATDLFQRRCQEVESEESRRVLIEVERQLELIREKLEGAEREFRTYKERTGNILEGTTPELKTLQEAYASDLAQLGLKEADLRAEKAQLAKLEAELTPSDKTNEPEVRKLKSRLRELEKERMRLENLGIRLTGISTIDRQIQEVEKQLLEHKRSARSKPIDKATISQWQELRKSVLEKEAELGLFKSRLASYKRAIDNYRKHNPDILSQSLELLRLKRSKEVYENIYDILLEKAEEERIRAASSGAGLKVVDIPRMPDKPIPKNETRYYIVGILLGLALGLALAFLIEFNDTSIKSTEDIERTLGVSVLGTIPHMVRDRKEEVTKVRRKSSRKKRKATVRQYPRQLLDFSGTDSVTAEAYRSLRTNLSFVSPDDPLQVVLVTSAGPSEGKSMTVSNLAMAYAQMGKRTLLVDTDLRRPVMHYLFNVKREPGFSELFVDNADYEKVIRPTEKENLFIVTAGMFTPNPAELIGSQKMSQHIDYFRQHFDIVFFDTPPIVAVTDASLLGTRLDGVLLVVRSHHTSREIASRSLSSLRNVGVKVLGAVLNDIDLSHRYSSYGYYKYYYHYYKTKKD